MDFATVVVVISSFILSTMRFHPKFRIFLLMLAFGLASARFFSYVYESWTEVQIDLPQVRSETPIVVFPKQILTKEMTFKRGLVSKDRDLSKFKNGGSFTNQCFSEVKDELKDCEKQFIKARKFIFKNWKEKKRAFIIYKEFAVDNYCDSYFFIQPDENGVWKIIQVQTYSSPYDSDSQPLYDILDLTIYDSVKFKRAKKDNYFAETGTYYLSFIDENGKEVEGL